VGQLIGWVSSNHSALPPSSNFKQRAAEDEGLLEILLLPPAAGVAPRELRFVVVYQDVVFIQVVAL
jgi:hypothetical protein